jgi:hypothetical protein
MAYLLPLRTLGTRSLRMLDATWCRSDVLDRRICDRGPSGIELRNQRNQPC